MAFFWQKNNRQQASKSASLEDYNLETASDNSSQSLSSLSPIEEVGATSKKLPKVLIKEQLEKKNGDFTPDGHPVDAFMQENRHAEIIIREMRKKLKKIEKYNLDVHWKDFLLLLNELKEIDIHFRRKEELLFPRLQENNSLTLLTENFTTLHHEIKKSIRNMIMAVKTKNLKNLKSLFTATASMIHEGIVKEEQILFPSALSQLTNEAWRELRKLGKTVGYCWIERAKDQLALHMEQGNISKLDGFRLETGFMDLNTIDSVLNNLPIEITVINADDKIIYYNHQSSRIFMRTPAFIGERYEDCHTGKNSRTVKKIIADFKRGKKDNIELYFNMENRKIFVQYKPLFNGENYNGFIEIATDITYFRSIEGEKIEI